MTLSKPQHFILKVQTAALTNIEYNKLKNKILRKILNIRPDQVTIKGNIYLKQSIIRIKGTLKQDMNILNLEKGHNTLSNISDIELLIGYHSYKSNLELKLGNLEEEITFSYNKITFLKTDYLQKITFPLQTTLTEDITIRENEKMRIFPHNTFLYPRPCLVNSLNPNAFQDSTANIHSNGREYCCKAHHWIQTESEEDIYKEIEFTRANLKI